MPHRVLVVGGGSIGERHVRCFIRSGRAQVSLCDNRPERLREMAAEYDLAFALDDIELVDFDAFDAVVICVPADLHIPFARRAVDADCHVFIEKPLAIDMTGIPELERAVEQVGLTAGVAYVRRAMPVAQLVKAELDSGRAGEILDLVYMVGYDHRVARPDYRSTYEVSRAMGGGANQDAISHLVNLLQWFMGPVASVTASYDHLQIEGMDAEDTSSVLLRFRDSRAMATIHCSMWHPARTDRLVLSANDEQIVCDGIASRMGVVRRETGEWTWTELDAGKRDEKGQVDGPFITEANNFLDAIEGKSPVLCSLSEATHTLQICMAAAESGRTQRTVTL